MKYQSLLHKKYLIQIAFKPFLIYLLILSLFLQQYVQAQCVNSINTFPYKEDFENTNGDWVDGGYVSSWKWGTPSKAIIKNAGAGSKCWITGGLSGTGYNNGESSWLKSPCFDFTTLKKPQISFMVFWETERKYDGASLQYSPDGGNTWQILGSINSNATCKGINWFNYSPVNYLGSNPGWSGNIQSTSGSCQGGGGSNGWVIAKHDLSEMAGLSNVIFRFIFGAGTTCNNFDGFAIDDITISEASPNVASFTYKCSNNSTVEFTNGISLCQTNSAWNFGDPSSGNNNTSSSDNPTHTFSSPGTYKVSYTANYSSSPSSTITNSITILSVTSTITSNIKCNGEASGAISLKVSGGNGSYNYNWGTASSQNVPAAANLRAGSYTVIVNGANACSTSVTIALKEPDALKININPVDARCGKSNGSVSSMISGGVSPYIYKWSTGNNTPAIHDLSAGNYSLKVTDGNGCIASANNIRVDDIESISHLNIGNDTMICKSTTLNLSPGAFSTYQWQDNSTASTFIVRESGIYFVEVSDIEGCKGSDTIKVTVGCTGLYFPTGFTPNRDGRNDGFGPLGDLASVRNYKMIVYNRWGQVVFASTDPLKKWNGTFKGKDMDSDICIWVATYNLPGQKQQLKKGTIMLIR